MPSYHFDCGNSNEGSIGFCARISAATKEEALAILRERLPEFIEVHISDELPADDDYITVYTNAKNVTIENIDMVD